MKKPHDLRDGFFDPEELLGKKVVELDAFVFVEPLYMGIVFFMDVANACFHNDVVHPSMGEFCDGRIALDLFQVAEKIAAPGKRSVQISILFNELFKFHVMVHSSSLPCSYSCRQCWRDRTRKTRNQTHGE